jgi:hypothetical protein
MAKTITHYGGKIKICHGFRIPEGRVQVRFMNQLTCNNEIMSQEHRKLVTLIIILTVQ